MIFSRKIQVQNQVTESHRHQFLEMKLFDYLSYALLKILVLIGLVKNVVLSDYVEMLEVMNGFL